MNLSGEITASSSGRAEETESCAASRATAWSRSSLLWINDEPPEEECEELLEVELAEACEGPEDEECPEESTDCSWLCSVCDK